jgi:hypothetical protein
VRPGVQKVGPSGHGLHHQVHCRSVTLRTHDICLLLRTLLQMRPALHFALFAAALGCFMGQAVN